MKLGHVHLKVKNLEISEKFYTDLLGLKVVEKIKDHFLFLSFGDSHHDIALQSLGEHANIPLHNSVGLYHVAFEVDSITALVEALNKLENIKYPFSIVEHYISWAIYSHDPDGNGIEIYLDRRDSSTGKKVWNGISRELTKIELLKFNPQ